MNPDKNIRPVALFQAFRFSEFNSFAPAHLALRAAKGSLPGQHPQARGQLFLPQPPSRLRAFAGNPSVLRHRSSVLGGFASPLSPIFDLRSSPRAQRPTNSRHQPLATRHGGFAAFTLIELLVVIAIIAILAAITLAAMGGVNKKAARDRTKVEINLIANALEAYRSQHGSYPPPVGGSNVPYEPISGYLQAERIQVSGSTLQDPFGGTYYYMVPGRRNRVSFDLYSHGGESPAASNALIGNW
jgi:general secretion pathway protein G